ncbi:MAG: hypothetical protein RI575_04830 [Balneolaceae bacterium]|nr:hypothetical protein [Balneolaceae bacterium]MDR9409146.1 hypothetical protein [Balneolaceae bacterium]
MDAKETGKNKWELEGFEIICEEVATGQHYTLKFTAQNDKIVEAPDPVLVLGLNEKRNSTKNTTLNRANHNYEQVVQSGLRQIELEIRYLLDAL